MYKRQISLWPRALASSSRSCPGLGFPDFSYRQGRRVLNSSEMIASGASFAVESLTWLTLPKCAVCALQYSGVVMDHRRCSIRGQPQSRSTRRGCLCAGEAREVSASLCSFGKWERPRAKLLPWEGAPRSRVEDSEARAGIGCYSSGLMFR